MAAIRPTEKYQTAAIQQPKQLADVGKTTCLAVHAFWIPEDKYDAKVIRQIHQRCGDQFFNKAG